MKRLVCLILCIFLCVVWVSSTATSTEETKALNYTTMGLTYSLPTRWQHIPVDNQNDIFVLDKNNMTTNIITVRVEDFSAYALMANTKSNKELMLNSVLTGAMKTMNMNDISYEHTLDLNSRLGIIKMGTSDYGMTTMYAEIINNKLFYMLLVNDAESSLFCPIDFTDCVFSLIDTNATTNSSGYKKLANNGKLVQHEQGKLLYKVWNDWICPNGIKTENQMSICQYFKTDGQSSDGILLIFTIENFYDESISYSKNVAFLLDIMVTVCHLTDIDLDYSYYTTKENRIMGYRATNRS